jgi:DNA-binding SARP family transcriptional activator
MRSEGKVVQSVWMSLVEVQLLGPLEVEVSGDPIQLPRKKQRALLALLALRPGEPVSIDRLVEDLWGHQAPKAAIGSLQNLVSQLRKALGADVLLTRPSGYALDVAPEGVDLHRFQQLVEEAMQSGAADLRAVKLRQALELWRGPALADLAYEPFAQSEIARLEEMRVAAREELMDAELECGRHGQLVGDLEALVVEHPLRERLRGQLMLALYRAGRQADALEAYRQARETLVEELGIDPSPELQHLEQAILRHDPALDLPRPATQQRPRPVDPDRRKTVTILFTDIVDSTGLGAQMDPEVLRDVMGRFFSAVETAVERHGGIVEKFIGDAAMAAFGIPTLREDDALRAVRAANDLHESIAELNRELEQDRGVSIQVRTGLNTGEVLVADHSSGQAFATGASVSVAVRIQQSALPGEILFGQATHRLVRHAVDAEPVEPLELGSLGRITAFRLLGVGEAIRPLGDAPLIGRADELAWLTAAFAGARVERRSRVVTVLGDAGVGKTRLASEFVSSHEREATTLVGRCVSYGEGATYLPLTEIIGQAAPERQRQAIASLLAGDEHGALIADRLTQLTAQSEDVAETGEVFWAVRRFLEALALERPLVVVLEDVHWAEPALRDLIEYLASWPVDAPLLVLCLARPDLGEQLAGWAEAAKVLALEPLAVEAAGSLISELAGDELTHGEKARIVAVAEGNPLFLEQLHAFVQEVGADALASVPPSVEALLAGRIERLEVEERALLERGAVAGREFTRSALVHLSPPDELAGLDVRLRGFIRRGLIRANRGRDEDAYRFHHVLIRDVTYGGITKEARADLHERYAAWLEQRAKGPEEIVGYHFEQAHRYRSELRPGDPALPALAHRAGRPLAAAGMRAWKRADASATVNLLGRAASLLPGGDPDRTAALCELGVAQRSLGEAAFAEATLTQAIDEATSIRDRPRELRARIELAHVRLYGGGDPAHLVELVDQAAPLFEEVEDERALSRAYRSLGYVRGSMQGRCAEWLEAVERALPYYRRSGWSTSGCVGEIAAAMYYGPTPTPEGVKRCERMLGEATDRLGTAHLLVFVGGFHALAERFDQALDLLDEADEIYRELDDLYGLADNSGRIRGRVQLLAGDPEAAQRAFRESCETFDRVHDTTALASIGSELGKALLAQGRNSEAHDWSLLAESRAPAGDIIAQFSWRALKAKLLAQEGRVEAAEPLALKALEIVEATDALTHRGEVLLDVASVLGAADRHTEAGLRIEQAIGLFERKHNDAAARLARSLLAQEGVV